MNTLDTLLLVSDGPAVWKWPASDGGLPHTILVPPGCVLVTSRWHLLVNALVIFRKNTRYRSDFRGIVVPAVTRFDDGKGGISAVYDTPGLDFVAAVMIVGLNERIEWLWHRN